jgi:hypothetical protein
VTATSSVSDQPADDTSGVPDAGPQRRPGAPPSPGPAAHDGTGRARSGEPRRVLGYRRQRFEARKVRRLVRHIDPWSMLKVSLLLGLCMWVIGLIASVIIWSVATNTGALDSIERFASDTFQVRDATIDGSVLFRQFGLLSLLGVLAFTSAMVVMSLVFNLISDVIGGVWVSVIEEETARPVRDGRSQEP